MTSTAYQGGGNVLIEFQAGANLAKALDDVRTGVDDAKRDLPQGADEPSVHEVNISEFPVLVLTLSGDLPERVLGEAARELRDAIKENVPGVLDATLQGVRDDLVEAVIDPGKLTTYGLRPDQLIQGIAAGNSLVAAGAMEGAEGHYAVKVPALIENHRGCRQPAGDLGRNATVRAREIADIRATLQGRHLDHPARRQAGGGDRSLEAHRRQPDRDHRRGEGGRRELPETLLPEGAVITFSQDKSGDDPAAC